MTDKKTKISDKAQIATTHYITNCITNTKTGYTWAQAMRDAGYAESTIDKNSNDTWGLIGVQEQIEQAKDKIKAESIATRAERQAFWTTIYKDTNTDIAARLRASELLGRSEADFTDNISSQQIQAPDQLTDEEIEAYKAAAKALTKPKLVDDDDSAAAVAV